MDNLEIKPGVYWVGVIDWDIRNFHGYITQRGTTYNAYLIVDEKITLVDTVKACLFDEMMDRIKKIIDPSKIDIIVSNHVEMDHTGSIPMILEHCPNAEIITSTQGEKGLKRHFKADWNLRVVKSGESMSIGKKTLTFVHIPMVHWPDSMVTYIAEDKLLLSNDAFGQHIATPERFDDELGWDVLKEEAAKYYANIVMPYGPQAAKAIEALGGIEIDMIAPCHGIIWRSLIPNILAEYNKWVNYETEKRALIVFDTMWNSTKSMAYKLQEGLMEAGLPTTVKFLGTNHISDIVPEMMHSRLILLGSPTLNNGMLPTMGAFLTYIKGLRPKKRVGFAFGSYGWGGQAVGEINEIMEKLKWDMPEESININYIPDPEELDEVKAVGKKLGEYILAQEE